MDVEFSGSGISEEEMRVWKVIAQDNADEFAALVKSSELIKSEDMVKLKFGAAELWCHEILRGICFHRAVSCGKVMMEGKDGVVLVDLNVPNADGVFPLHEATCSLSPGLVELFLQNGANADCRLNGLDAEKRGLLPFQIALQMLSSNDIVEKWRPKQKQSMFKLITILCNPKMRDALETIRLLVQCNREELSGAISYYALKGKVVELTALLMVAREKVMGPFTVQYVDGSEAPAMLGEFIQQELAGLIDLGFYLMGRKSKEEKQIIKLCQERKSGMMSLLPVLGVFEPAGVAIEAYVKSRPADVGEEKVAEDVARLFTEAGFKLKHRRTRTRIAVNGSVEKKIRQIEDSTKSKSGGEDAVATLCEKQDTTCRSNDDIHMAIEMLRYECSSYLLQLLARRSDRRLCQWTQSQSIIKLIITLCLPEMKHVLETAKSLELNRKEISEAACYFAMKGKLIELAILLMVAREEVMGPVCAYESEGYLCSDNPIPFRQFVRDELAALIDLEFYLVGRREEKEKLMFGLCKKRQSAMFSTLPLLQVFDMAGVAIEVYVQSRPEDVQEEQVVQDVARLLAEKGFKLKSKDIDICPLIDRTYEKMVWKHKDKSIQVLRRHAEGVSQMEYTSIPPYLQQCGFLDTRSIDRTMNNLQRFIFARNNHASFGLSSNVRQFHTSWTSRGTLSPGFPKAWEVPMREISRIEQNSQKVPAQKWVYTFVSVAKSVIRRV